jgi:hypothetical protein
MAGGVANGTINRAQTTQRTGHEAQPETPIPILVSASAEARPAFATVARGATPPARLSFIDLSDRPIETGWNRTRPRT